MTAGRMQTNGFDQSDYPYLNFFKLFRSLQSSGGYDYPRILDVNGYPVGLVGTTVFGTLNPLPTGYAGNWVVKWAGAITGGTGFQLSAGTAIVSGGSFVNGAHTLNTNFLGTDGRVVFSFLTPPSVLSVNFLSGTTYTGVSGMVLCREADEASLDAGGIFNPDFLSIYRTLSPAIIRTMLWNDPNDNNNLSRHSYRKPVASFSYTTSQHWVPTAWVGDLGGTDTYTCSAATDTPVAWTDGEVIQARIVNANTVTTPTLNVNGRGAKTIVRMFITAVSAGELAANQVATFVYDAVLDKLLYRSGGLTALCPLEIHVALANTLNVDLWYCLPHLLDDASVTAIATYIKANLSSALACYIEFSNEVWNFGGGFPQTYWAVQRGIALSIPSGDNRQFHGPYGKRVREVMGLFTTVWAGATAPRLKRVMAWQAFGTSGLTGDVNKYRLQGFDLGSYGYNSAPNRPIDYCDVLSYATYFSGDNCFAVDASYTGALTTLLGWADDYDSGDATRMNSALDAVDADIRGSAATNQTLYKLNASIYPVWETIAASYTGKVVCNYEGGCEIAAPTTARLTVLGIDTAYSAKIATLFAAYKNDYRFKALVSAQMRQFMAQAHSDTPSWFVVMGTSQWSAHTGDIYSTAYKSWDALVARNAGKESFRLKLTA